MVDFHPDSLLRLLRSDFFAGLVMPVLLLVITVGWKERVRPAGSRLEDRAVGLDLLVTAIGSQVSFLAEFVRSVSTDLIEFKTDQGLRLLGLTVVAFLLVCGILRWFGYEDDHETPKPVLGVWLPNVLGFIALVAVFAVNSGAVLRR